jgi:hypothetical protein
VTRRISLGCALLSIFLGACHQTLALDDLTADASRSGSGGNSGSGGKGGSKPTDGSADGPCGQGQQIFAAGDIPQVVVALDRSSEMLGTQFGGGQNDSQFNVAVSDLSAQVGNYAYSPGSQHSTRRAISFSYIEFPESTSDCNYAGCCSTAAIPTSSYQAFTDATMTCSRLGTCGYLSSHPIGAALTRAEDYFRFGTFPSDERYVLLVTDDAPDGNCNTENDCQFAQDQVNKLASSLNVTTVVIHVGTGSGDSTTCLQNFAFTQGAPPAWYTGNDLYYAAPMADDLQRVITTAISAIAAGTCRFTLATTPGSPTLVSVYYQGYQGTPTLLPQDPKNGWTYDAAGGTPRLTLRGSACTSYLNSQSGLLVYQGCGSDRPPAP